MKKLVLLLFAVVLGATYSMAQPGGGMRNMDPEQMAKRQTDQIKEAVGLNADQEKKVYDLNLETSKKQSEMFQGGQGGGDFSAMREKMTQLRADQDKKLKDILTADQWKKYEEYQANRPRRGPGGGGAGN